MPGSYALHAVATVKSVHRLDRRFSMFRFARYVPSKLAEVLAALGWDEVAALDYGQAQSLRLFRKRAEERKGGEP